MDSHFLPSAQIRREMEEEWGTYDKEIYNGNKHEGFCQGGGAKGYKPVPDKPT